ncbi:MAG: hypothetical protein K6A31_06650 [Fibrobacter sp.]|nr:hypothetical protein [Fibrobacter sp.]
MEGIRTIHLAVSSDEVFFPTLKESVVDYASALDVPEAALACVKKETEQLFEKELSSWKGTCFTLEISAKPSMFSIVVLDADHQPVAKREIPVA